YAGGGKFHVSWGVRHGAQKRSKCFLANLPAPRAVGEHFRKTPSAGRHQQSGNTGAMMSAVSSCLHEFLFYGAVGIFVLLFYGKVTIIDSMSVTTNLSEGPRLEWSPALIGAPVGNARRAAGDKLPKQSRRPPSLSRFGTCRGPTPIADWSPER